MTATATATESCDICLESYNGRRPKLTCQYCPYTTCRGCAQRYLTQSFEDPHCMDCKRGWSAEFMAANFPLSFRNDTLRKWRRKVLVERERASLPMMQQFVEYKRTWMEGERVYTEFRAANAPVEAAYAEARQHYYEVLKKKEQNTYITMVTRKDAWQLQKENATLEAMYRDAKREWKAAKAAAEEYYPSFINAKSKYDTLMKIISLMLTHNRVAEARYNRGDPNANGERREFVMKCPDEGCRGFLSSAYKCGTCEKWTCASCLVVLGKEKSKDHVCNADEVESAKAIKAETRPCPKCGTRIFKVEGCDQMMCTMGDCNTAFSWRTGQIETGRIHNPHYYEWLRRTGGQAPREGGDIPCGGLPDVGQLYRNRYGIATRESLDMLMECYRRIVELQHEHIPKFPANPPRVLLNKDVDVQYLMQEIDEKEWCRQLEFTEARLRRKKEIGLILQMAIGATTDLFREVIEKEGDPTINFGEWLRDTGLPGLEDLRAFVNESLQSLAVREHMAVPQFGKFWRFIPCRALYKKAGTAGGSTAGAAEGAEA